MELRYAELSCATHYSFLRGSSSPQQIAKAAADAGLSALALTDRNGVYGMPKVWGEFRKLPNAPKLLVGAELRVRVPAIPDLGVNLIAKDRAAYGALCRILTEAHRDQPKGQGFLPLPRFLALMREFAGAEGIFIFPQWEAIWERQGGAATPQAVAEPYAVLANAFDWVREFSSERVFFPLSRALDGRDPEREAFADELSRRYERKLVAHNRVLYHHPHRRRAQDALSCIREGTELSKAGYLLRRNREAYLKSPSQMHALFRTRPELIEQGLVIADQCVFLPSELRYHYPSEWIPAGHSAQTYLQELCREGARERYPSGVPAKVEGQLQTELKLVAELQYADYFLTVYDIVKYAKDHDILCQGRGSAANSVICYVLGVTAIDPIQMNLLFERFISAERGEPPDIDVDFEHERREEVIQYIYQKYGRHRAAMVSAVITYRGRSALREAAKVFGVPVGTLNARKVEAMLMDPQQTDPQVAKKVGEIAAELEDTPRHLSIHSGGFTLSALPITELVPVEPATMEGRTIIQWDKYDLDILGLLKVDVLALGMLTALQKGLKLVGRKLYELPQDDPETYAMIQKADTIGTFQIESRAQMSMLPRLRPENMYDLVVEVALVRPGPIVGGMVHPYLENRRNRNDPAKCWKPEIPELGPILQKTYGVPIFQEQVMKMAISIAKFTPGEADQLRRAIGAWRSSGSIDHWGQRLAAGLTAGGLPLEFSKRIFEQIKGFAEYGFPESHAASFALLAYASCWLKCHYPAEFLVAMLNSQPLGFYAPHTLIDDAKRHGAVVLPISLSRSEWDSQLEGRAVRLGFSLVHGMSEKEAQALLAARKERPFAGFQDFVTRVGEKGGIKSAVLRTFAVGDVFREFGLNQREALWKVLAWMAAREPIFAAPGVQGELFRDTELPEMSEYEQVLSDYRSTGVSTRGHPMKWVRAQMKGKIPDLNSQTAKLQPNGRMIRIPGLSLVMQRPPTANGTAFATLEDEYGFLDLILHKNVYQEARAMMAQEPFVIVHGVLQRDREAASLVVKKIEPFFRSGEEALEDTLVAKFEISGKRAGEIKMPDSPGSIARRHVLGDLTH